MIITDGNKIVAMENDPGRYRTQGTTHDNGETYVIIEDLFEQTTNHVLETDWDREEED